MEMDVLSDIVEMIRTGPGHSLRLDIRSPWAFRAPESLGAVFHPVLRGSCWLILPDGRPPLALGPGDLVLFPRFVSHVIADDPQTPPAEVPDLQDKPQEKMETLGGNGTRSLLISGGYQLDYGHPHPLLTALPDFLHVSTALGSHHSLRAMVSVLGDELDGGRPGGSTVVSALVDALFPLIVRAWVESHRDCAIGDWTEALTDPDIAGALERIHSEFGRAWTVAALAREVGLSRAAFARRFAHAVGMPPLAYLTRWRMTIAGRLLRETDLKLTDVAGRVGYSSEFAFSKAFKLYYGVAPRAYRVSLGLPRFRGGLVKPLSREPLRAP